MPCMLCCHVLRVQKGRFRGVERMVTSGPGESLTVPALGTTGCSCTWAFGTSFCTIPLYMGKASALNWQHRTAWFFQSLSSARKSQTALNPRPKKSLTPLTCRCGKLDFPVAFIRPFAALFQAEGPRERNDLTWSYDALPLAAWAQGRTGFPFIDANMRQLGGTGWMSNRGRQNVASFLAKVRPRYPSIIACSWVSQRRACQPLLSLPWVSI